MRNPYKTNTRSINARVHPDLLKIINQYRKRIQRDSDVKFGKNKFIVSKCYASKKLAEVLK